jgi:hypothetical protein
MLRACATHLWGAQGAFIIAQFTKGVLEALEELALLIYSHRNNQTFSW